jgi:hypothetical protein
VGEVKEISEQDLQEAAGGGVTIEGIKKEATYYFNIKNIFFGLNFGENGSNIKDLRFIIRFLDTEGVTYDLELLRREIESMCKERQTELTIAIITLNGKVHTISDVTN